MTTIRCLALRAPRYRHQEPDPNPKEVAWQPRHREPEPPDARLSGADMWINGNSSKPHRIIINHPDIRILGFAHLAPARGQRSSDLCAIYPASRLPVQRLVYRYQETFTGRPLPPPAFVDSSVWIHHLRNTLTAAGVGANLRILRFSRDSRILIPSAYINA